MKNVVLAISVTVTALASGGCSSVYYSTMEKFGVHKRDILVSDVTKARDAQAEAKKQFSSALEEFTAVLNVKGGELEDKYKKLDGVLKRSEARANEVHSRIREVERVADALFREWKAELAQYSSASLRSSSEAKMRDTRRRYDDLMAAMRRAEDRMEPVLVPLRDQVLYLKHNLNAAALTSIREEVTKVEADVARLVKEMEAAIAEADKFIKAMPES